MEFLQRGDVFSSTFLQAIFFYLFCALNLYAYEDSTQDTNVTAHRKQYNKMAVYFILLTTLTWK
jgi:hypothetical protein